MKFTHFLLSLFAPLTCLSQLYVNGYEMISGGSSGSTTVNVYNVVSAGPTSINGIPTGGVTIVAQASWTAAVETAGNTITVKGGLPDGTPGVGQVATWNGTNWTAQALGAPASTPFEGTTWTNWTLLTNWITWAAPSTQIVFTAWGGAGAIFAGGAGHVRAYWKGAAGTLFDIMVPSGATTTTNGMPGGGIGKTIGGSTTYGPYSGGGCAIVKISGTTNYVLVAGGSGGGGSSVGAGAPGGSFYQGTMNGVVSQSNCLAGFGAWASNEYGLAATPGTNVLGLASGSFLQGGNAATSGYVGVSWAALGGGGAGWEGGCGGVQTNSSYSGSGTGASGSGGLSYVNPLYCVFAQVYRGETYISGQTSSPAGQDHPTYVAGRGCGNNGAAGGHGLIGATW